MKKKFSAIAIILVGYCFAQTKFHNVQFPNFDKTKTVNPSRTQTISNRLTKQKQKILSYNQYGVLHGPAILFSNGAPYLEYYNEGHLIYRAVPVPNSSKYETICNLDTYGNFDGEQINNQKNKELFAKFKNGKLIQLANNKLPNDYKINFKEGKLDGDFFFYDDINCGCFYSGVSKNGKVTTINQIKIRKDLTYVFKGHLLNDDNSNTYKTLYIDTNYSFFEIKDKGITITNFPIVVENRNVDTGAVHKIIFDKQLDWILFSDSKSDYELEKIDFSDTQYGPPEP